MAHGGEGAFDGVGNRYESFSVPMFRCDIQDRSVWCDHRDRGTGSTKGAGRPMRSMSRELELVAGRLCDSPGCAESANQ